MLEAIGPASFASAFQQAFAFELASIAVGELSGDTHLDIAASVPLISGAASGYAILQGDGTGGFAPPLLIPGANGPERLSIGDADGDGRADLLSANKVQSFSVARGDGQGGILAMQTRELEGGLAVGRSLSPP